MVEKIRASIDQLTTEAVPSDTWAAVPSVGLTAEQVSALDDWIADQPDPKPSRGAMIREALTEHLKAKGYLK